MTNIPIDVSLLIGTIGCVLAVVAFADGRRKIAIQEGKHLEEVKQLKDRTDTNTAAIANLRECYQTNEADTREIRIDLGWIKQILAEIQAAVAKLGAQ